MVVYVNHMVAISSSGNFKPLVPWAAVVTAGLLRQDCKSVFAVLDGGPTILYSPPINFEVGLKNPP